MIIKVDLINKVIYIDEPTNLADFIDTVFLLTEQDEDEELWTILPMAMFQVSLS
jgi:hypothetical protein